MPGDLWSQRFARTAQVQAKGKAQTKVGNFDWLQNPVAVSRLVGWWIPDPLDPLDPLYTFPARGGVRKHVDVRGTYVRVPSTVLYTVRTIEVVSGDSAT